ncbi:MAG: hypothetical protein ACK5LR_02435 [Mangrovibacterium sp.]
MRRIIFIVFLLNSVILWGQQFSEAEIKELAKHINQQSAGVVGDGIVCRSCVALGRTLYYTYDVDQNWIPMAENRSQLVEYLKSSNFGEIAYKNDIDLKYEYFKGKNKILEIYIQSKELSTPANRLSRIADSAPSRLELGDFVSIAGHPKSKGVNLKLRAPVGWKIQEGDRPNVVKKFVKDGNTYLVMTKENLTFTSRNESNRLLQDESYISSILAEMKSSLGDAQVIESSVVTVDSYPALFVTMQSQIERLGIAICLEMNSWYIFYEDKIIILQSSCLLNGATKPNEIRSLSMLITNTVVFPDRYK